MNGPSFDRIARSLAAPATRRAALALAAAVGAGRLLGDAAPAVAKKTPKKKTKGCAAGRKRCGKRCIPKKNCCKHTDCDASKFEACMNGRCGCRPGEVLHNGVCGEIPTCGFVGKICASHNECCSFDCSVASDYGTVVRCNRGNFSCYTDYDCNPGLTCRGYVCRKP